MHLRFGLLAWLPMHETIAHLEPIVSLCGCSKVQLSVTVWSWLSFPKAWGLSTAAGFLSPSGVSSESSVEVTDNASSGGSLCCGIPTVPGLTWVAPGWQHWPQKTSWFWLIFRNPVAPLVAWSWLTLLLTSWSWPTHPLTAVLRPWSVLHCPCHLLLQPFQCCCLPVWPSCAEFSCWL